MPRRPVARGLPRWVTLLPPLLAGSAVALTGIYLNAGLIGVLASVALALRLGEVTRLRQALGLAVCIAALAGGYAGYLWTENTLLLQLYWPRLTVIPTTPLSIALSALLAMPPAALLAAIMSRLAQSPPARPNSPFP